MSTLKAIIICMIISQTTGCYVVRQAYLQNNLFNSRQKIDLVLQDKNISEKIKQKLKYLKKILAFAKRQGLKSDGAYEYYIHLEKSGVSYLVGAALKDKLQAKTWWFPIVGSVPYLGFFYEVEREEMAHTLRDEGFDVATARAAAFSSLGWFEDPIYTPMLARKNSSFVELMLHELTHRSFWAPGSVEFNENLASFVGFKLAEQFLSEQKDSQGILRLHEKRKDRQLFGVWLRALRGRLKVLYTSEKPREQILYEKQKVFSDFLNQRRPKFKAVDYIGKRDWNNATVLGASLYTPDVDAFEKAYKCVGDTHRIKVFLDRLKVALDQFDDPYKALDGLCVKMDSDGI